MSKGGGGAGGSRGKGTVNPATTSRLNPAGISPVGTIPKEPPVETGLAPYEIGSLAYERRVRQFEKNHFTTPVEHGSAYDANGNLLYSRTDNNPDSVAVPGHYNYSGGVFTHNHPEGTPFSYADLQVGKHFKVDQMRAFGTDEGGKKWRFVIRPPVGGWDKVSWQRLTSAYHAAQSSPELQALGAKRAAGELNRRQLNEQGWDVLWRNMAAATGIRYRKYPAG